MFNTEFNAFAKNPLLNLYPAELASQASDCVIVRACVCVCMCVCVYVCVCVYLLKGKREEKLSKRGN